MRSPMKTRALNLLFLFIFIDLINNVSAHRSMEDSFQAQWPYNSPLHAKYLPEDQYKRRQDIEVIEPNFREGKQPVAMMKMSPDEGEKFYMKYWQFERELSPDTESFRLSDVKNENSDGDGQIFLNETMVQSFRPSFSLHQEHSESFAELRSHRNKLQKRDYKCPIGTSDCSGIGYPNSCCPTSDTCFAVQDTGLGPVGCCPKGSNCGGTVDNCNSLNTACPASLGGGCCIRNYICAGIGCIINPTVIITTVISVTTMISSSSLSSSSSSGGASTSEMTSATGGAPVRPTSLSSASLSESASKTLIDLTCPTGFYACKAFHAGGCCRTGRNCDTTSCPPISSTSLISNSVTIIVPVGEGASTANPVGTCATGWASCASSEGGGCCPSGWKCGPASCSNIEATETKALPKDKLSLAGKKDMIKIKNIITNLGLIVVIIYII